MSFDSNFGTFLLIFFSDNGKRLKSNMSQNRLLHEECNGSATLQSSDRIERSDVVPMLASEAEIPENDNQNALTITRKYVPVIRVQKPRPCDNKKRIMMIILGSMFVFIALVFLITGTIRFHQCHPSKVCMLFYKSTFCYLCKLYLLQCLYVAFSVGSRNVHK